MKKLFSILLCLTMLMALTTTALADDTDKTSITIDSREYNGYRLLTLTISLKAKGDHHPDCNDTDHLEACYNYAYQVNEAYRDILQRETHDNGGNYLWEEKPEVSNVTDDQILKYLANQTGDNNSGTGTMRQVADRIYREILRENIPPETANLSGSSDVELGYWLFADVTELVGNDSNSLVIVDTKGESDLAFKTKVSLPTVEKKVKDIEDSEDENIGDNPWYDSADHDIGDSNIPFKLTATIPDNYKAYYTWNEAKGAYEHSYKMVFHDTLSEGLTLDESSFKVLMYETKYKADVDTDLNDDGAVNVTRYFTQPEAEVTDGCSFHLVCNNIFAIFNDETLTIPFTVTKDVAFVVYYEAALDGQNVVIGGDGNPNTVYLEYSNNPYGDGTGTTEKDTVTVFTYQLTVNKTDNNGKALAGAGFTLYKKDKAGVYHAICTEHYNGQCADEKCAELVGADEPLTSFQWKGLDDGDYKLVETTVPQGYNGMEDVTFSITATHSETADAPILISLDGGKMGNGVVGTGTITKDIVNNTGTILPETGAAGTLLLISGGAMFVILAAVFMVTRKKMSVYED